MEDEKWATDRRQENEPKMEDEKRAPCVTCGMAKRRNPGKKQIVRPPTSPLKSTDRLQELSAMFQEMSWSHNLATHARPVELGKSRPIW